MVSMIQHNSLNSYHSEEIDRLKKEISILKFKNERLAQDKLNSNNILTAIINELKEEKQEILELNSKLKMHSTLYKILNITSKSASIDLILQDVLDEILSIEWLNTKNKGVILTYNNSDELYPIAHRNNRSSIVTEKHYEVEINHYDKTIGFLKICIDDDDLIEEEILGFLNNVSVIISEKIILDKYSTNLIESRENLKQQKEATSLILNELISSIDYAGYLQKSLIPNNTTVKKNWNKSFTIFHPKDHLSGDFLLIEKYDNIIYFAVADCTGHGVPGAILGAMFINALRFILSRNTSESPNIILEKLRKFYINAFKVNDSIELADSMDIAFCSFDTTSNTLEYSGANIPIVIMKNKEIITIKATKNTIGKNVINSNFQNNKIKIDSGDTIYITSDGLVDQFGYDKMGRVKKLKRHNYLKWLSEINNFPIEQQKLVMNAKIKEWKQDHFQLDDITVLAIEF